MKPSIKLVSWTDLLYPGRATDFFRRRNFLPFDPSYSLGYTGSNALWLAEISRLAYKDGLRGVEFPDSNWVSHYWNFSDAETDTQALLIQFGGKQPFAVLAFRGTEQKFKDIEVDICMSKTGIEPGIMVHGGFYEAFQSVWPAIKTELDVIDCPIFYTGHSLGGALATLAAYIQPPQALYTFGSPRVGNEAFAKAVNAKVTKHYRVVDDIDIVASVPPEEFGFRHCGTQKILGAFPTSFWQWLTKGFKPPKFLADHAPINYVDRI